MRQDGTAGEVSTLVGRRVEYPISKGYCKTWTITDALRELIANALDASPEVDLSWSDGDVVVWDFGGGLDKKALLVGFSSKADKQIGQFGEGLKIAALVLAREGRSIEFMSGTVKLSFAVEHSAEYDEEVLVAYQEEMDQTVRGTLVKAGCTAEEFEEARNLFIRFRTDLGKKVDVVTGEEVVGRVLPEDPGKIFVMGVFVAQDSAMFGYDLLSKGLMNRDRTILDQTQMRNAISKVWNRTGDRKLVASLIEKIVLTKTNIESGLYLQPVSEVLDTWKEAAVAALGKRTCRADGASAHVVNLANERNWNVLENLPWQVDSLLGKLGIPTVMEVFNNGVVREGRVLHQDLTDDERKNIAIASEIAWEEFGGVGRIKVFDRLDIDGLVRARPVDDGVEILRSVLVSLEGTVECLLHEGVHKADKHSDGSVAFENAIMKRYAKLAIALHVNGGKRAEENCAQKVA